MKLAIMLLCACGKPAPEPTVPVPTTSIVPVAVVSTLPRPANEYGPPPQLEGDAAAQCKATEPRALPCMDALFAAYAAASLGVPADELSADLSKKSDEAEARTLHLTNCLGDPDFLYIRNIVACWNEPGCDAFAACVEKRTERLH